MRTGTDRASSAWCRCEAWDLPALISLDGADVLRSVGAGSIPGPSVVNCLPSLASDGRLLAVALASCCGSEPAVPGGMPGRLVPTAILMCDPDQLGFQASPVRAWVGLGWDGAGGFFRVVGTGSSSRKSEHDTYRRDWMSGFMPGEEESTRAADVARAWPAGAAADSGSPAADPVVGSGSPAAGAVAAPSWPQAAARSPPRDRRTVATLPAARSVAENAATAPGLARANPTPGLGLYSSRLILARTPVSRAARRAASAVESFTPASSTYWMSTNRPAQLGWPWSKGNSSRSVSASS